jgi:hypothetical protein
MIEMIREKYHLGLAGLWVLLTIPALLWWKESIIFVILLSLYANYETSMGAYHARKAEKNGESK